MGTKMRMVMLEFNELCSDLIQEFMADGHLPNFRRLYDRSTVYATQAGETAPRLEPWIQWPTVHSGMTYAEHGVFELGEIARDDLTIEVQIAIAGNRVPAKLSTRPKEELRERVSRLFGVAFGPEEPDELVSREPTIARGSQQREERERLSLARQAAPRHAVGFQ